MRLPCMLSLSIGVAEVSLGLWTPNLFVGATLNRNADPVLLSENIPPPDPNMKIKVACYYYPWHAEDFHRDEEYLRDYLYPRQQPSLGEYDDRDEGVIREHLRMSRQANCRIWIASWFGPGKREDTTLLGSTFPVAQAADPDHRIAIHYEISSRIKLRDTNNLFKLDDQAGQNTETHYYTVNGVPNQAGDGVVDDMVHFCNNYFNRPNYYHIGGRPVIFMYLSRTLDDANRPGLSENGDPFYWAQHELLETVVSEMRNGAKARCNKDPYIVGDHIFDVFNANRDGRSLEALDAITAYDVYGQMDQDKTSPNGYAFEEMDAYFARQEVWKSEAKSRGCAYIPGVTPGFNDRAVRLRFAPNQNEAKALSRRIRPEAMEGSLLAQMVARTLPLLDSGADFVATVTSFNEFHEDTQLEMMVVDRMARAVLIANDGTTQELEGQKSTDKALHIWNQARNGYLDPSVYLDTQITPPDTDLTQGLFYEAYYDLYLNILRATTLAPFFVEDFESTTVKGTLQFGAQISTNPTIERTKSLKLVKVDQNNAPNFRIELNPATASQYNFLFIEFMFYSERSEAGEFLRIKCLNELNGVVTSISDEKWEFGREFKEHRKAFYGVTECNIAGVPDNHKVLIDIVYESFDDKTSVIVDSVKVTGLTEARDLSSIGGCASDQSEFILELLLDRYAKDDNSWTLKDAAGTVVDSRALGSFEAHEYSTVTKCLTKGQTYTWTLLDAWGDSICCAYGDGKGDGYYKGTLNGAEIFKGGSGFGSSVSVSINVPGDSSMVTIFQNQDFELGFGAIFNDGGGDCDWRNYADEPAITSVNTVSSGGGNYCIRLRDNSVAASSMFTSGQTVGNFASLKLEFDYYARSFENGEDFMVEWKLSGGTAWVVEERWVKGTNIVENQWLRAVVNFDAWEAANPRPQVIDLRIRMDASDDNDVLYVDNVVFYGMP